MVVITNETYNQIPQRTESELERDKAIEYEEEWKREFEDDSNGIISRLRTNLREAYEPDQVSHLNVIVSNLSYISPPLPYHKRSFLSFIIRTFRRIFCIDKLRNSRRKILSDINIELPKHSMTIVLGSPASGKVSFFLFLENVKGFF